jgi:alpha-tubulin suppressor-like RCC1 family protein
LGDGGTSNSNVPVAVSGGLSFASIAAGADYTCAVTAGGAGYCWGAGALGGSTNISSMVPVAVVGGLTFSMISADHDGGYFDHVCGVTTAKLAYCWGVNSLGQLGNGTTNNSFPPTPVSAHP